MSSSTSALWTVRRWFDSRRILVTTEGQRVVLMLVAIATAVFLSGTFMGINSLQSVWAKQGHYLELCNGTATTPDPPILVLPDAQCQKQAMKLLTLSHVASGVTYAMIPITGILTDWQGARRVYGGVVLLLLIGNLIAIFPNYWTQFIGTTIMAGMGPCLAFNLLVWAQLVPGWTHWIVAIVTAAFPGGSFFLGTLRLAFLQGHFSISAFFALWLIASIPACYLFIIWPRGVGKPYAASHPLLMLAYFDIVKAIMIKIGIPIPDEVDVDHMVELEDIYTSDENPSSRPSSPSQQAASLGADDNEEQTPSDNVMIDLDASPESYNRTTIEPKISVAPVLTPVSTTAPAELAVALDSESRPKVDIKRIKWMDQLNSGSIVLLQAYFLVVCVWLAIVANLGAYRMAYWAKKTGGSASGIAYNMSRAKTFLPYLEIINIVSIFAAPIAAITIKSVGAAGGAIMTQIIVTLSAMLCLSTSFDVQILNYYLFPVVRGLLYPFAMMFLIQTCGRRHLGLLWAMTISGASPTDFIRTFLIKWWLSRYEAWDVLNGVQLAIACIGWIWPVYAWVNRASWEESHPEPLS